MAFGRDYEALADALDYAAQQLRLGTPSENITWDDRSHVSFDVFVSSDAEFCAETQEDPHNFNDFKENDKGEDE